MALTGTYMNENSMGRVLRKNVGFVNLPESSEKSYHLKPVCISTNMHYILRNS